MNENNQEKIMFGARAQIQNGSSRQVVTVIAALLLAACSSSNGTTGTGGTTPGSGGSAGTGSGVAGQAGGAAGTSGGVGGQAGGSGGAGGAAGVAGQGGASACNAPVVDPEQVTGTPNWTAVAWAVFVAPLGTIDDVGTTLNASFSAVWAPNHGYDSGFNQFKSTVPHAPPYDGELAAGLAQTTFVNTGCVPASAFTAPSGVLISAILVPSSTAPTGASFEDPTPGPIIPGTFSIDGDLLRNGVVIDPAFDSTYVKEVALYPASTTFYAGYGHIILNFAENSDFSGGAALTAGDYAFRVKVSDGSSGTTSQTIHFTVN